MLYVRETYILSIAPNIATSNLIKPSTSWQNRGLYEKFLGLIFGILFEKNTNSVKVSSPRLYLECPDPPMYHDYGCDCVSPVPVMEMGRPRRLEVVSTVASVVLVVQGVSNDSPAFHLENATWPRVFFESKMMNMFGNFFGSAGLLQLKLISCVSWLKLVVASSH